MSRRPTRSRSTDKSKTTHKSTGRGNSAQRQFIFSQQESTITRPQKSSKSKSPAPKKRERTVDAQGTPGLNNRLMILLFALASVIMPLAYRFGMKQEADAIKDAYTEAQKEAFRAEQNAFTSKNRPDMFEPEPQPTPGNNFTYSSVPTPQGNAYNQGGSPTAQSKAYSQDGSPTGQSNAHAWFGTSPAPTTKRKKGTTNTPVTTNKPATDNTSPGVQSAKTVNQENPTPPKPTPQPKSWQQLNKRLPP
ncbi:MAG TPA: hypothetical protein VLG38_03145 [Gammaproteobacteria bacterium]|nr:hypothetical protein [Gammaproteobacteria bacterium]